MKKKTLKQDCVIEVTDEDINSYDHNELSKHHSSLTSSNVVNESSKPYKVGNCLRSKQIK